MDWNIQSITALFLMLSAGGTVGYGVWKYGINPVLKKERKKKEELREQINFIANEMKVDGNGSLKTAVMNLQKTTERIEVRLDGIEENQKVYMDLQGVAYWISDEKGDCTHASKGLCKLLGRNESELKGKNWMIYIHKDDKEKIRDAWEFSTENNSSFDEIFLMRKSGGKYIKVWAVAFPKAGKSNLFGGVLGKMTMIEEPSQ